MQRGCSDGCPRFFVLLCWMAGVRAWRLYANDALEGTLRARAGGVRQVYPARGTTRFWGILGARAGASAMYALYATGWLSVQNRGGRARDAGARGREGAVALYLSMLYAAAASC